MRKLFELSIALLAIIGLTINVVITSYDGPFNIFRGLYLFRYFTLQSNLLVAVYFILKYFEVFTDKPFFNKLLGGITIYITITFIVFASFLEGRFEFSGWHLVSNIVAHYIVPSLTIGYLVIFRRYYNFIRKDIIYWVIYPLGYIAFMVVFGMITGDYLYPFFQVSNIGVLGLVLVVISLVVFFLVLSFIFMKIVSKIEFTKEG